MMMMLFVTSSGMIFVASETTWSPVAAPGMTGMGVGAGDIPGVVGERQRPAVGHVTLCRPGIFGKQPRRQVDAFQASEAQSRKCVQPVSVSAKEFDNRCVTRPVPCPKLNQSPDEFAGFLFGGFETSVCRFPEGMMGFSGSPRRSIIPRQVFQMTPPLNVPGSAKNVRKPT